VVKKYSLVISIALLIVGVIFQTLPFYLYTPLPSIFSDSFDYFWVAKQIYDGNIPVTGFGEILPIGYPLFLAGTKVFSLSWKGITVVHLVAYTLASAYLCYAAHQHNRKTTILVALACLLYLNIPSTLNYTFSLYTESLYTSSMIFLAGAILHFGKNKSLVAFLFLCLSAYWSTLLRSNGIALFGLPILLILITIFQKTERKLILKYAGILVLCFLLNASGNKIVKGKFLFGDLTRFTSVVVEGNYINKKMNSEPKFTMYQKYLSNFSKRGNSYYYFVQELHYNRIVRDSLFAHRDIKFCDGSKKMNDVPGLQNFVFEGMPQLDQDFRANFKSFVNLQQRKSLWMKMVSQVYQYLNLISFFSMFLFLFWILLVTNTMRFFTGSKELLYPLLVALIYLIPIIILPLVHPNFHRRYIAVSEFAVLIYIALSFQNTYTFLKNKFMKAVSK
jgi:hypothetical protein